MREQMMMSLKRRRKLLRNPLFNYVLLMFHFITFYLRSTLNYDNFLFLCRLHNVSISVLQSSSTRNNY